MSVAIHYKVNFTSKLTLQTSNSYHKFNALDTDQNDSPKQTSMCTSCEPVGILQRAFQRSRSVSEQGCTNPGFVVSFAQKININSFKYFPTIHDLVWTYGFSLDFLY